MKPGSLHHALAVALLSAGGIADAASFAAPGAQGTLTVDYVYESAGRSGDRNDQREWTIKHTLSLRTELAAQRPSPLPQLQAAGADEVAGLQRQHDQVQRHRQQERHARSACSPHSAENLGADHGRRHNEGAPL